MMRTPLLLAVSVAMAACATIGGSRARGPEAELERGVAAAAARDFDTARKILEPLYRAHWGDETGERALMVLTALELDPRNADRRLYAASDFATMLLGRAEIPAWEKTLAETMYLLSVELGGHEQQLDRAAAVKDSVLHAAAAAASGRPALPSTTRESWPTQLRKVRDERDALTKRVETLQATVRTRERDLAEARQELERIKKTLKIK